MTPRQLANVGIGALLLAAAAACAAPDANPPAPDAAASVATDAPTPALQRRAYGSALSLHIKRRIDWNGTYPPPPALCEVEARLADDGVVQDRWVIRQEGPPVWCETVLRAIDKASPLPRDASGRVPTRIQFVFHSR